MSNECNILFHRSFEHFNEDWLSKIKENVPLDNWRLRVSNVKKVIEGVQDFYDNVLCLGLPLNVTLPDALLIGRENNKKEVGRLIQLILGAAVNCDHKEHYIAKIMALDTETQMTVKQAIEELFIPGEVTGRGRSDTASSMTWDSITAIHSDGGSGLKLEIKRLNEELARVSESKEKIAQEMFDVKRELSSIKEQNSQIVMENDKLSNTIKTLENSSNRNRNETNATTSETSDASLKEIFVNKLQSRIEGLMDDLFKMENAKEEIRIKNELLEKELMDVRFKNEDLTRKANEARNLKDELDILKQQAEKADKYEQTIENLKKRLEEMSDFKRKIKYSGDDGIISESKLKLQLEEELRKNCNLKTQIDNLKKQVSEMHANLAQVNHCKDSAEFEVRMLKEKYEYLAEEKQFLLNEMNEMRRLSLEKGAPPDTFAIPGGSSSGVNLNHELANSDHQSRVKDLERENFILRQKLVAHGENEDTDSNGMPPTSLESSNKIIEALRLEVYDYQQKVIQLEGILQKKEEDIADMEARYRKCVNKAKQVAKVLEPISITSSNSSINSMANFEQLAVELQAKDQQLHELEAEHEKTKALKEVEEKLMSVAFHSLAFKLQRSAAEERMTSAKNIPNKESTTTAAISTNANSTPNGSSVSFLTRQKQAAARRFNLGSSAQQNPK